MKKGEQMDKYILLQIVLQWAVAHGESRECTLSLSQKKL